MNNEITIDGIKYVRKQTNMFNFSGGWIKTKDPLDSLLSEFKEYSYTPWENQYIIKIKLKNGDKIHFIAKDFTFEEFANDYIQTTSKINPNKR